MEDNNPYRAPEAVVADVAMAGELPLASLGDRFLGALVDGLIMLALVLPIMFMGGYFQAAMSGEMPGIGTQLLYTLIGFVVFCAVQAYPLSQTGQTWGKRVMKTRIVDLAGAKPSLATLLAKRYLPVQAAAAVPFVGNVLVLVDTLLIFRADRRCGHDLIAGTRVIKGG